MYPKKALFRVDVVAGCATFGKRKFQVVVTLPRETPKPQIHAAAREATRALTDTANTTPSFSCGRIVLMNPRHEGEVDSLAPKLGKEYEDAAKRRTLEWLLADRLSNYGYEWRDWCQLRSQRQAAKRAVEKVVCHRGIDALDWGDWNSARLILDDRRPEYQTGQSNNEEITGCLRVLAGLSFYPKTRD